MDLIQITYYLVSIVMAISLHEYMHAQVAYWLDDDLAYAHGRTSLNPLKHIDIFTTILLPLGLALAGLPVFGAAKPVPINTSRIKFNEWGMALVAVCGPLTNLLLAVIASGLVKLTVGLAVSELFSIFMQVNLGFFVFNMIPWPPLDGSRILYALAPDFLRKIMEQIESFGLIGIGMFIFVGMPIIRPVMNYVLNIIYSVLA